MIVSPVKPPLASKAVIELGNPNPHPIRVAGLDTLRFVLAFWVVLSHLGPIPLVYFLGTKIASSFAVRGLVGNLFVGVAAVIAFFVISGFCIHMPYARGKDLVLRPYFLRREIRILVPIAAVVAFAYGFHSFGFLAVIWSIVCEEIYYAIYPAILAIRRRWGWRPIFLASSVFSLAILVTDRHTGGFHSPGYALTWLFALPIWLSGCVLAERCDAVKPWKRPDWQIWVIRLGVWAASSLCSILKFHSKIDYMYTLLPFSAVVYLWLTCEIAYFQKRPPKQWMEIAGRASYSTYLVHMFAISAVVEVGLRPSQPFGWVVGLILVAALTAVFYKLVELPAHKLARRFGK